MSLVNLSSRGIRNCKRNPQIVSGTRKNLRTQRTSEESIYICGIRNNYLYLLVADPQKHNVSTKIMLQVFVRGIHRKFCTTLVSGLQHVNFAQHLSLDSSNLQTPNFAPISRSICPRNGRNYCNNNNPNFI